MIYLHATVFGILYWAGWSLIGMSLRTGKAAQ